MPNSQPVRAAYQSSAMNEGLEISHTDVEIGILIFDIEHRAMLDKLHQLYDCVADGQSKRNVQQSLAQLIALSKRHFDHEEDYMKNWKYRDLQKHTEDHHALLSSLEHFVEALFSEGVPTARNLDKVRSYFRAWFTDHILEHDRTLANFLTQMGIR